MGNNKNIKSIQQLVYEKSIFLIDDYQRGYKWSTTEVTQLLNDINEFEENGFYCLQPVVVKRKMDGKIELIDGQQRITTIYIILSCLNEKKYEINYFTRGSSATFLTEIMDLGDPFEIDSQNKWIDILNKQWNEYKEAKPLNDNIDNFHFFQAYQTIMQWFIKKDKDAFKKKLLEDVKVIWYEVPGTVKTEEESKQESIKIFTRINSGKIPLTNAELIKALFLINVEQGKHAEVLQLKQNEIAQQWDTIEYALQDDAFWYFLSNELPTATRIDFIFDLIIENKEDKNTSIKKEDKLYTFLHYTDSFSKEKNKAIWVETEWEKVKITFQTLKEWYEDRKLYHFIGFLIWKGSKVSDILNWKKDASKINFETEIQKNVSIRITKKESLQTIKYGDNRIKAILLLFNILTIFKNETSTDFSFNKFKDEKWDIEHIHAQQSKGINRKEDMEEWVKETKNEIEKLILVEEIGNKKKELLCDLKGFTGDSISKEKFDELFQKVIDFYEILNEEKGEMNALSNLALLDAGTNRSYKNAIFSVKRNKIIERDEKGIFIPICTKNVFLKYYTKENISQMFLWSYPDQKKYFEAIENTLKGYITINS